MDLTERPLRVLFVVPDLRIGGAERHVTTLLPRMDARRFTCAVICLGIEGGLFDELTAAGIDATAWGLRKRQAAKMLWKLARAMRSMRPDVVVVRGYNAEMVGRVAARFSGVTHAVLWVHNIADPEPRSRVRCAADHWMNRWTSAYFGVADAQRRYLSDTLGYPDDKIRIIYNGVDTAQFDPRTDRTVLSELGIAQDDPAVGIVAALRPEKDHVTFLRAARYVADLLPQAKFLVVGDGPTRPGLEQLCRELDLGRHVRFVGARRDVDRILRGIDVFALSSSDDCFPIALLEAMASGRPAVCTAVGGIPEMIVEGVTGYLVPPGDPRQLAGKITAVASDAGAARRMGAAARRRVEVEFSLESSVAAAEWAIEAVAAGPRPHGGPGRRPVGVLTPR